MNYLIFACMKYKNGQKYSIYQVYMYEKNLNGTGPKLHINNNSTIPLTRNIIFGNDS